MENDLYECQEGVGSLHTHPRLGEVPSECIPQCWDTERNGGFNTEDVIHRPSKSDRLLESARVWIK